MILSKYSMGCWVLGSMNFDVFISYPHQDKATADAACAKLEAEGIRCWIAPRDVPPGAEWAEAIVDAIDGCRAMILIFSSSTNASRQIRREVQQAFDGEKPVVPFRIENVVPERSLRYYMGSVHWLDALTPPLEQHLEKLAASVQALVRRAAADEDVDKDRMLRDAEMREQRLRNEAEVHKREAEGHDRQEGNAAATRGAKENGPKEKEAKPQGAKARRLRNEIEAGHRAEEEARRDLLRSEARPQWSPARPKVIVASLIGLAVLGAIGLWLLRGSPTPVPVTATPAAVSALSPEQERAVKPKDTFKECQNCPEMVVVPAGTFTMGSPASEPARGDEESPQHMVAFANPFAVGKFALTFDEWNGCVADGGCNGYNDRSGDAVGDRDFHIGFRVGRTLTP
jgi:hypothetical protein